MLVSATLFFFSIQSSVSFVGLRSTYAQGPLRRFIFKHCSRFARHITPHFSAILAILPAFSQAPSMQLSAGRGGLAHQGSRSVPCHKVSGRAYRVAAAARWARCRTGRPFVREGHDGTCLPRRPRTHFQSGSMAATVGVSNLNALRSFSGSGQSQGLAVKEVATQPIEGQKTGTSGLRKKTKASMPAN